MGDAPQPLLLRKVVGDAPFLIGVHVNGVLVHVVQQVEIEVAHPALGQLLLEDLCRVVAVGNLVARILVRQVVAVARIAGQAFAQRHFREAVVVGVGGVEVVHTAGNGGVHHGVQRWLVDGRLVAVHHRQPHGAKAQQANGASQEFVINHVLPLCLSRGRAFGQYGSPWAAFGELTGGSRA